MLWAAPARAEVPRASEAIEAKPVERTSGYDEGFFVISEDKNYALRMNIAIQFRYTYLGFDDGVRDNYENWSGYSVRRANLTLKGNAPSRDWAYYFQIQLEPQGAVNLSDAYIAWKKYPFGQIQAGRGTVPYGLEVWYSSSRLNGVDRSIFSGEPDADGKSDTRKWPGGNANFPSSDEDPATKFPIGGLNLGTSQGFQLQGDLDMLGRSGLIQYWAGMFNGRNTKGKAAPDTVPLYAGRIALNPAGKCNLFEQGDYEGSESPKLCMLFSAMQYTDRTAQVRSAENGDILVLADYYDVSASGYNAAGIFRFRGFSLDAEYGAERFKQERAGGRIWERMGYRANAGFFVLPQKLELTGRHAYVERLIDNTKADSLASGLGLVSFEGANNAVEDNLTEYTAGINYYIDGHRLKLMADYGVLYRGFSPAGPGAVDDQRDIRARGMVQWFY